MKISLPHYLVPVLTLLVAGSDQALAGDWIVTTVDSTDIAGQYTSLALDYLGRPSISYFNNSNGDLKYADNDGTSWSTTTVDSTGNVGSYNSLALDAAGNPSISYLDFTNRDLKYAAFDGISWSTTTVDSTDDVGRFTSLALDADGNPSISYLEFTHDNLKYATVPEPSTWALVALGLGAVLYLRRRAALRA